MNEHYKFLNTPLPYPYNAMEPYIDEKTMKLHHDRHLQAYIDNLNNTLSKYPQFQNWTLEKLIVNIPSQCHLVKPVSTGFTAVLNFRNRYTYVTQNLKNITFPLIPDS